jgi:hypothetical protein
LQQEKTGQEGDEQSGPRPPGSPRYASLQEIVASAWNWHRRRPQGFAGPEVLLAHPGPGSKSRE